MRPSNDTNTASFGSISFKFCGSEPITYNSIIVKGCVKYDADCMERKTGLRNCEGGCANAGSHKIRNTDFPMPTYLHDEVAPHQFLPTIVVSAFRVVEQRDLYHFLPVFLGINE